MTCLIIMLINIEHKLNFIYILFVLNIDEVITSLYYFRITKFINELRVSYSVTRLLIGLCLNLLVITHLSFVSCLRHVQVD